ncbi:MAG: ATP-binding protein [Longimicrobiaceae bacterium]
MKSVSVATDVSTTTIPALEAIADAFCTVGEDWNVSYWNRAAERWFGVSRDDTLGQPLWDALPELDEPGLRARMAAVAATAAPLRFPFPARDDGTPLSLEATPLEGGGVALHFRDGAEQARLAERYSRLLASIRDGFLAVDTEWRVVYLNPAAEALLRVRLHKAVGASLLDYLPDDPPELKHALHHTMEDGLPRGLHAVRPGAEWLKGRCFDLSVDPLAGGGISLLFQDVTDRQEREMELARLAGEAEEASRAKSRFFAAVSHELRTPLHAIVGYTHLLSTDSYGDIPAPASRAAERASVCAEHLARLIDDVLLLTTAEIDQLQMYPARIALPEYAAEVLEPLRRQAEAKGLRFELDVPAELPPMQVDPERMRQVLYALVTNAIKFTARGHVRVQVREDGPGVEIRVEDSGPGVAEADRARIFEVFEQVCDDARTDSMSRGTGLGLAIARSLTDRLDGSLRLEQPEGGGSAFVLWLPLGSG